MWSIQVNPNIRFGVRLSCCSVNANHRGLLGDHLCPDGNRGLCPGIMYGLISGMGSTEEFYKHGSSGVNQSSRTCRGICILSGGDRFSIKIWGGCLLFERISGDTEM